VFLQKEVTAQEDCRGGGGLNHKSGGDPQIVVGRPGSEMCICAQGVPCAYDTSP
jgi:hypothetical protein